MADVPHGGRRVGKVELDMPFGRQRRPRTPRTRRRSVWPGSVALALAAAVGGAASARAAPTQPTWPTEIERLVEVLRTARDEGKPRPAVSQRLTAVRALSTFPAEVSGAHLAAALADPSPQVRLAAIDGCERVLSTPCAPGLTKLSREDPSAHVRIAAMGTLAALAPAEAARVLTEAFDDRAAELRAEALRLFGELGPFAAGHGTNAAVAVARRLTDPVAAVRAQAAAALGRIGGPSAPALLLPLLSDPAPDVQKAAATALARLDAPDVVGALAAGLEQRADRSVHWVFLEALARLSDPRAEDVLLAAIDLPPEDFGPVQVLRAIADRPAPSLRLARAIADGLAHRGDWSPAVRRAAAEALLRFGAVGANAAKAAAEGAPPSRAAALRRIVAAHDVLRGTASGFGGIAQSSTRGDEATDAATTCPDAEARPRPPWRETGGVGPLQGPLRERLRRAVAASSLAEDDLAALEAFLAAPYRADVAAPLLAHFATVAPHRLSRATVHRLGALVRTPTTPPGVACLSLLSVMRGATRADRDLVRGLVEAAFASPSPSLRACAVASATDRPASGRPPRHPIDLDTASAVAATRAAAARAPRAPGGSPAFPRILPAPTPRPGIRAFAGGDGRGPAGFPDLLLGAVVRPVAGRSDPGSPVRRVRWPEVCRAVAIPKIPLGSTYFSVVPAGSAPAVDAADDGGEEEFQDVISYR
ncbi:MAG: HEAT repeat domain-containing protein [Deltaproteobacteria bacterium]|nr:MAG: HEAT repeat domain-containing protein [Deltaproteobacteria bacterium]